MWFWKDRGYLLVSDIERENLEFLELLNTLDYCGRNDSRESIYRFSNHFIPGALELLDEMGNLTPSQFLFFKAMSSLEHRRLTGEAATDFLKALYGACTEVDVQRGRRTVGDDKVCLVSEGSVFRIVYPEFVGLLIGDHGCNIYAVERRLRHAFGCNNYKVEIAKP